MTKNCARDAKTVRQHLEDSLRRLQTDVIDLMQFHEINYDNDPDWVVEQGGAGGAAQGAEGGQGPLRRLHRAQVPAHPPEDAAACTSGTRCRCRSTCATTSTAASSKQVIPEAKKQRHRRHRHEEPRRRRRWQAAGSSPSGVCTAEECIRFALSQDDRIARGRHRLDERAEAGRRDRPRLQADAKARS